MTPWTAAHQASLSFTISQSLLKLMSIKSLMPSNHLILCCPLLFLLSIFPSIRIFPNELALDIMWLKGWSFHEIILTRTLEWVAISFTRGSSWLRDRTHISCSSCIGKGILYHWDKYWETFDTDTEQGYLAKIPLGLSGQELDGKYFSLLRQYGLCWAYLILSL